MSRNPRLTADINIEDSDAKRKIQALQDQGTRAAHQVSAEWGKAGTSIGDHLGRIGQSTGFTALAAGINLGANALRTLGAHIKETIDFLRQQTQAAREDEKSIVDRNAALAAMNGLTAENIRVLEEQAATFERVYGISDEYTRAIQTQLLAQKVAPQYVEELTQASIQLAKIQGTDGVDAAKKLALFTNDVTDKVRGSTIAVDAHASAQTRVTAALEGTRAGMALMNGELTTTEGQANRAAVQLGNIGETLGYKIGNSPDMATAFGAIADTLALLNKNLQNTPDLALQAARALLTVATAAYQTGGTIEQVANYWANSTWLPGGKYDKDYTFGVPSSGRAWDWLLHPEKKPLDIGLAAPNTIFTPDGAQILKDALNSLQPFVGPRQPQDTPGLQVPGDGDGSFIKSLNLPKRKEEFSEYMGFRPQHFTELEAAGGFVSGSGSTSRLRTQLRGQGTRRDWYNYYRDRYRIIPDLSDGVTVGRDLRDMPIFDHRYDGWQEPEMHRGGLRKMLYDEGGQEALIQAALSGGARGFATTAGGLIGASATSGLGGFLGLAGGPIGSWLGRKLGGIGKFLGFGGGGSKAEKAGLTKANPLFVWQVNQPDPFAVLGNISRLNQIRGGNATGAALTEIRAGNRQGGRR